jgi:hypothetical protein
MKLKSPERNVVSDGCRPECSVASEGALPERNYLKIVSEGTPECSGANEGIKKID